jgi:PAS domain S-box-containing protein
MGDAGNGALPARAIDVREPDRRARTILDEMFQFVALLERDGRILEVNKTALDAGGVTMAEVAGVPIWQVPTWAVTPDNPERVRQGCLRAAAGELHREEIDLFAGAGGTAVVTIDFSLKPIRGGDGEVRFILAEGRDITEKKAGEAEIARKNQELRALYERLEELDRLKTQFFANVSHELRTPLALILGPVDRVLDSLGADDRGRRDLETVRRNARLLLRHVNDLLDASKLEVGKMSLETDAVDVGQLVRRVAAHFESLGEERHIRYEVEARDTFPAMVDPDKLQRVLLNLLSNAFKFTPAGGAVRCTVRGGERLVIEVADSGPGVREAHREVVFERFRQIEGNTTRRFAGTGLGLSIARDFVQLHGGKLAVGDAPEGGAMFVVDLPLVAPRTAPAALDGDLGAAADSMVEELRPIKVPAGCPPDPADARQPEPRAAAPDQPEPAGDAAESERPLVLVVEDNPDMNRFLAESLAPGHRIATAFDGAAGLASALRLRPDLILSDVMMPGMSGDSLLRELRARPELAATPVVMLTAKADDDVRVQLLRAGASDYVTKPFSVEELCARVDNLLHAGRVGRENQRLADALREQNDHLTRLAGELSHANRELESFTYAVSHDLRAPLRTIDGFSQALLDDYAKLLEGAGQDYLRRVRAGVDRMSRLIDDLLRLSRVARADLRDETVDLTTMAREIAAELARTDPARKVDFRVEPSPPARGDRRLLRIVMENLVGNAWKFTGKVSEARIEFGAIDRDGRPAYYLRDNGAGFDMRYSGKLFAPFQRLHTESDFPGTGVGLATVQRIVRRHAGVIWADSVPDKGATFFFTIGSERPA